jgi:hypothetical protein
VGLHDLSGPQVSQAVTAADRFAAVARAWVRFAPAIVRCWPSRSTSAATQLSNALPNGSPTPPAGQRGRSATSSRRRTGPHGCGAATAHDHAALLQGALRIWPRRRPDRHRAGGQRDPGPGGGPQGARHSPAAVLGRPAPSRPGARTKPSRGPTRTQPRPAGSAQPGQTAPSDTLPGPARYPRGLGTGS